MAVTKKAIKKKAATKKVAKKDDARKGVRETRGLNWNLPKRPRSRQLHIQLTDDQNEAFHQKCVDANLPRSTVGRLLIDAYLSGKVKLKTKVI